MHIPRLRAIMRWSIAIFASTLSAGILMVLGALAVRLLGLHGVAAVLVMLGTPVVGTPTLIWLATANIVKIANHISAVRVPDNR